MRKKTSFVSSPLSVLLAPSSFACGLSLQATDNGPRTKDVFRIHHSLFTIHNSAFTLHTSHFIYIRNSVPLMTRIDAAKTTLRGPS